MSLRLLTLLTRGAVVNSVRCLSTITNTLSGTSASPTCLFSNNPWIWRKPEPIKLPISSVIKPLPLPEDLFRVTPINEPTDKIIEDPVMINNSIKEAARLIVIRRKKMKKHKLKKLYKRRKYEYAKIRQRRELKKEKEFHAVLIAQCKEAEAFSAEEYVAEKIRQATAKPPPLFWQTEEYKKLMERKKLRLDQKGYLDLNAFLERRK